MTSHHVYGVGNALVDMEFEISDAELGELSVDKGLMTLIDLDRHHQLLSLLESHEGNPCGGGSAANTITACAQLGGNTFYSCKVANDDVGTFFLNDLRANGVHTNLEHQTRADGVTGKCIVLITPDAERSMNTFLGITSQYSESELVEEDLKQSQVLYIEGYLVAEPAATQAAIKARKIAEGAGVLTALTLSDANMVNFFKPGLLDIIGDGLDLIFCNEDEAMLMTDTDSIDQCVNALKPMARQFAITRGAKGAVLWDGNSTIEVPASPVTPVDSNGAGDIYAGTFLYGLTHGMPFEQCGALANAAAAKLITQFGARLPMDELKAVGRQFGL
ncbi:MAG: adenosine kinase [Gammaproteobacteria bacterium]|nr:adenosine kinase [Gammaproteobacteria bacterium]